jgi:hypothetical protein
LETNILGRLRFRLGFKAEQVPNINFASGTDEAGLFAPRAKRETMNDATTMTWDDCNLIEQVPGKAGGRPVIRRQESNLT